jgi:hypothetical protein
VLRHAQNAVRVGHRPPPEAAHSGLDGGEHGVILLQVENDIRLERQPGPEGGRRIAFGQLICIAQTRR